MHKYSFLFSSLVTALFHPLHQKSQHSSSHLTAPPSSNNHWQAPSTNSVMFPQQQKKNTNKHRGVRLTSLTLQQGKGKKSQPVWPKHGAFINIPINWLTERLTVAGKTAFQRWWKSKFQPLFFSIGSTSWKHRWEKENWQTPGRPASREGNIWKAEPTRVVT